MPIIGILDGSGDTVGAPTIGTATPGNTTASVTFTPPTYTGKGGINYIATSSPGGFTATSATSPIVVTGLTIGTSYTFTVYGLTDYGIQSASSAASNAVSGTNSGGVAGERRPRENTGSQLAGGPNLNSALDHLKGSYNNIIIDVCI